MKSVLITGGAGFIGSHLVERCLEQGWKVTVLDDLSTGRLQNLPREITFIQEDIRSADLDALFFRQKIELVCHLAARVSVRASLDTYIEDADINFIGTLRLARAALKARVARFVFASSMAVYPDPVLPLAIPESTLPFALSPYGVAKAAAERDLEIILGASPCRPIILRYFNTFGPRQTASPYVGVVTHFSALLKDELPITIYGDGLQVRDFVHVGDVAQATFNALQRPAANGIYNIGSGEGISILEVARHLLKLHGKPDSFLRFAPRRTEEVQYSVANILRAQAELGFIPTLKLIPNRS